MPNHEPEIVNDFMHFVRGRTFVSPADWRTKTPNMARVKMAVERNEFVKDKDHVEKIDEI